MVITYSIHASVECVEKKICDIDKKLQEVEKKICDVEKKIQEVENKVEESVDNTKKWEIFMKKEQQLREDKKQLRKEKEQLMALQLVEKKDLRLQLPTGMYCIYSNTGFCGSSLSWIGWLPPPSRSIYFEIFEPPGPIYF